MPSYLVTGASRGLGYGWIKYLSSIPGNTVFGIVRNKASTEARLAKDNITNVHILAADVTDLPALKVAATETAKITGGALDFLIHNAALIDQRSSFLTPLDGTPESFDAGLLDSFNANVVGTAHVIHAFLPLIRQGKEKKVIVTSTGLADLDLNTGFDIAVATPYSVSKAACNMLVGKYHAALGRSEGILFFSMCPGVVDTSEGKSSTEDEIEGMKALLGKFETYKPGFGGPITVQESVEAQMEVIGRATVEGFGGRFVSHFGNRQWV